MDWRDVGIVLSARPYGEGGAIASLLTASHGRHAGLVAGGRGRSLRASLEPGTLVSCRWGARLEAHLGRLTCEAVESSASSLLSEPDKLAALAAFCALTDWALPERQPCPELYDASLALLVALQSEDWATAYVQWEALLLAEAGFPLDLSSCAVTGSTHNLHWVSPKTGRAVCDQVAEPYIGRLLPLPAFLARAFAEGDPDEQSFEDLPPPAVHEVLSGLSLTGYFLLHRLGADLGKPMPTARERFVTRLRRQEEQAFVAAGVDP